MRRVIGPILVCLTVWFAGPASAPAQAITVLHSFQGGASDGKNPSGTLLLSGSSLYGLTFGGGNASDGTLFQIGTSGTGFGVTHSFAGLPNDGRNPADSLIRSGPMLFGVTSAGGSAGGGTVFGINLNGTGLTTFHNFAGGADGDTPVGTLLQSGSVLYGTTNTGGASNGGTVFSINTDGSGYRQLHVFAGGVSDGKQPNSGALVQSGSGLYGMTTGGGAAGLGTIFKINTDGSGYSVFHSFTGGPFDGWGPAASLVLSGTTLFGTTFEGGSSGEGTLFEIQTDGTGFRVIHSFAGGPNDGANPSSDLLIVGSTLFGTAGRGGADALGTLFAMNTDGSDYSTLHSFAGGPGDGSGPEQGVILVGSDLDGMTALGGTSNAGVIYSFPVPEPSTMLLIGPAGASIVFASRRWRGGANGERQGNGIRANTTIS